MICALIVAGGSGSRMNRSRKKQYLMLDDLPIVAHTLLAFDRHPAVDRIVLVAPKEEAGYCRDKIVATLSPDHDIRIVEGGKRRQDSVANGLEALDCDDGVVLIHDGVRPFVQPSLIDACITGVRQTGACIPAVPATDTIKKVNANNLIVDTLKREQICLAQTPQAFSIALIKNAHHLARQQGFGATDDASIAEFAGEKVVVIPGDPENLKITHPHDLLVAREILGNVKGRP
jgi:2-C-methyl-D-erythritol 4-phosphate cytidylyltransferase